MTLRVSGKHVDIGDSLRAHIENRIEEALGKYFGGGYSGHVTLEREGSGYRSECMIHLDSGIDLQSHATAQDPYGCFDQSADRIEKRLRRYKRKLKDHKNGHSPKHDLLDAAAYVLRAPNDDEEEVVEDYNPIVIAEASTQLKTMTVSGAVMAMDLSDHPVVVFRNAGNGGINVVYRRTDGNIGWIDPTLTGGGQEA